MLRAISHCSSVARSAPSPRVANHSLFSRSFASQTNSAGNADNKASSEHYNLEVTTTAEGIKVVTYGTPADGALMSSVGVYVKGGVRAENHHTAGYSYLVKELGFRGTETFGDLAVTRILEQFGAQASVNVNREYLGYTMDVPRSKLYSLAPALGAQVMNIDLADHVLRDRKYLAECSAREAVSNPVVRLVEMLHQEAFRSQTLGQSLYGTHHLVPDHFDPYDHPHPSADALGEFLADQVNSDGVVVVATGGVNHATFAEYVSYLFEGLTKDEETEKKPKATYSPGESRLVLPGDTYYGLGFQGVPLGDQHTATAQVLSSLLGEARLTTRDGPGWGATSLLNTKVRGKDVDGMKAFHIPYSDTGLFGILASVSSHQPAGPSFNRLLTELANLKKTEVSAEELNRAKTHAKFQVVDATSSPSKVRDWLADHAMSNSGTLQTPTEVLKALDSVTAKDVHNLASKIFTAPALVSIGEAVFPTMEEIRAQLK